MAVLERRMASLLGKDDALFFPSGTMAQQVALRVHADRRGRQAFAAHPQSHLEAWEHRGHHVVHGLRCHPAGDRHGQLFGRVRSAPDPDRCSFEVSVGVNAMELTPDEVVGHIHELLRHAT
ncbi:beta-eliminating lyase-related protein [Micromonospora sp. NPDC003944]